MPDLPQIPRRLAKYLRDHAGLSHRAIKALWQAGRLGHAPHGAPPEPVRALRRTYVFEGDLVTLDGAPLPPLDAPCQTWMLHKPRGVVSTTHDPQGRPCLGRWLNKLPGNVFPVGRLDRETSGLILLTNDGDLTFLLLSPQFHVQKLYDIGLASPLEDDDPRLELLRQGVDIQDGKGVARATCLRHTEETGGFILGIKEGRNRQVRKMCRAARLPLTSLHRTHVGPLHLGRLPSGQMRPLEPGELDALWAEAGGRHLPRARAVRALWDHAAHERTHGVAPLARLEQWLERHGGSDGHGGAGQR